MGVGRNETSERKRNRKTDTETTQQSKRAWRAVAGHRMTKTKRESERESEKAKGKEKEKEKASTCRNPPQTRTNYSQPIHNLHNHHHRERKRRPKRNKDGIHHGERERS